MYWPFGSSLVIGPPGWRWIMRTSLPETSAMRPPTWNEPMPRSTMSSAAVAVQHTAAASAAPIRMRRIFLSPSVAQTLLDQPALNELGDLVAVLVHHHHVRVALDADVGQVDEIDAATARLQRIGVFDNAAADFRPARMILRVVADHDQHRRVLDGR